MATCGRRFRRTFSIKSQRNCLHVDKSVFYVVALAANELQQTRRRGQKEDHKNAIGVIRAKQNL